MPIWVYFSSVFLFLFLFLSLLFFSYSDDPKNKLFLNEATAGEGSDQTALIGC